MPSVRWAMGGHSLAFKGLRRLCPWWHAIYDLVNPFLIILLWQRWKYPTSNDWLYWYAAICASVEEQSHKSNKLEKPLFSSEREILSGWEQETWCKGISAPRRGSLWSVVKSPFLLTRHIYSAPNYWAAHPPPGWARLIAHGWSLEFLSAFVDIAWTSVKCLWLCGCSHWLVIYHICSERMIRKHILGQKKGFQGTINWCCWRGADWGQNGCVYLQTRMTGFHHRERNKIHLMNPDESKYDIVFIFCVCG